MNQYYERKFRTDRCIQKYGNSILIKFNNFDKVFVIGPHWLGVVVTVCLLVGGTFINLRMLRRNRHYTDSMKSQIVVFMIVFFVLTHCFLFLTAFSDPGIVFKNKNKIKSSNNNSKTNNKTITRNTNINNNFVDVNEDDDDEESIESNNNSFNINNTPYCEICRIKQPIQKTIHHCDDCNYCVEGLDHHCPWMGQCIGKKNIKFFFYVCIYILIFFFIIF